jgi:hypothetical protein
LAPQVIDRQPGGGGCEPGGPRFDGARRRFDESQENLLLHVLRGGTAAKHAPGRAKNQRAVLPRERGNVFVGGTAQGSRTRNMGNTHTIASCPGSDR